MKTLRRPMFRKGGEVGGGIMTGVMRENYAVGSARERLARVAAEFPSQAIDPLSQFLIQGGLNLASQPASGGGVIADAASAFKDPTTDLFKGLAKRGEMEKKLALEGEILDIEREGVDESNRIKQEIAKLEDERVRSEGNLDRQNKIDIQIQKGKDKLAELQFKKDNPEVSDLRTDQVRPAFENVVNTLTKTYVDSKNPAVKANPNQTAFNVTKFRREAKPEVLSKYKGFKPYTFDNKGNIMALPTDRYQPGDIIYDPLSSDFLIFDNAGGTYKLNPLTFEIEED